MEIMGHECTVKKAWVIDKDESSLNQSALGVVAEDLEDPSYKYAFIMVKGKPVFEQEYDHMPAKEEIISNFEDYMAEKSLDEYEAEFGADGNKVFRKDEGTAFNPSKVWLDGDGDPMFIEDKTTAEELGVSPSYDNACVDFILSTTDENYIALAKRTNIEKDLGISIEDLFKNNGYLGLNATFQESNPDKPVLAISTSDFNLYSVTLAPEEAVKLSDKIQNEIETRGRSLKGYFDECREGQLEILPHGTELDDKMRVNGIMGMPKEDTKYPYITYRYSEIGKIYEKGVDSQDETNLSPKTYLIENPVYQMTQPEIAMSMAASMQNQPKKYHEAYLFQIKFNEKMLSAEPDSEAKYRKQADLKNIRKREENVIKDNNKKQSKDSIDLD